MWSEGGVREEGGRRKREAVSGIRRGGREEEGGRQLVGGRRDVEGGRKEEV